MRLVLVLAVGLIASAGWGQELDASLPDASVGGSGAEQSQEQGDGLGNTVCAQTRDCERGFVCTGGTCTYSGSRPATCRGCGGPSAALAFPLLLALPWRRRVT